MLGSPGGKPVVITKLGARPPDPAPVLIHYVDQSLEIFVVGNDLTASTSRQPAARGGWSGWASLGFPGWAGRRDRGTAGRRVQCRRHLGWFTTDGKGTVQQTAPSCRPAAPTGPAGNRWAARLATRPVRGWPWPGTATSELELFMVDDSGALWHRWQLAAGRRPVGLEIPGRAAPGPPEVLEVRRPSPWPRMSGGGLAACSPPRRRPGLLPWLRFAHPGGQRREPWGDWLEFPLSSGSATASAR